MPGNPWNQHPMQGPESLIKSPLVQPEASQSCLDLELVYMVEGRKAGRREGEFFNQSLPEEGEENEHCGNSIVSVAGALFSQPLCRATSLCL